MKISPDETPIARRDQSGSWMPGGFRGNIQDRCLHEPSMGSPAARLEERGNQGVEAWSDLSTTGHRDPADR